MKVLVLLIVILSISSALENKEQVDKKKPTLEKEPLPTDDPHLLEYAHDDPHGTDHGHLHTQLFLGTTNTKQPFEHLTEAQKTEKVLQIFSEIDENKDNVLDYSELKNWIIQSMRKIDYETANVTISNDDGDGDHKVSWSEMLQVRHKFNEAQMKEMHELKVNDSDVRELVEHIEDEKLTFDRADQNKDGFLDVKEYAAFISPWKFSHMLGFQVDDVMQKGDLNKDNVLDLNEYIKYKKAIGKDMVERVTHRFHVMDRNNDDKLSYDELLHVLTKRHDIESEREAKHILMEMDTDKDGHISKKEVLNQISTILHGEPDGGHGHDEL